ncbi:MAG: hypothetical protein E7011_00745 [Alphaproteobacteria bacterium]|nr:hypothetical protein [Alphaproteobacteria bacterium]
MNKNFQNITSVIIAFLLGFILGMWAWSSRDAKPQAPLPLCNDGSIPDHNGCCPGEIYTDMDDLGYNCCPQTGGDCFPPLR